MFDNGNASITMQKIAKLPILKLGDFGFARSLEFQSLASTLCGSPLYMAPEILKGEKYDSKTDLWSVGAIIFEMITGRPPFKAQNHIELLRKIEKGDGWIRFPDESIETAQFSAREYHGAISRTPNRKSFSSANSGFMHVGSLGASPRFGGPYLSNKIPPLSTQVKALVRALLERNPVNRISFEEFFIHPIVVECRLLDAEAQNAESNGILLFKQFNHARPNEISQSNFGASPRFNESTAIMKEKTNLQILPFPDYEIESKWMEKDMAPPMLSNSKSLLNIDNTLKQPEKILQLELAIKKESSPETHSEQSFGSSLDSVEFTSDEDKVATKAPHSNQNTDQESLSDSGEFVLIEKGGVEIKWHVQDEQNLLADMNTTPTNRTLERISPNIFRGKTVPYDISSGINQNHSSVSSVEKPIVSAPKGYI